MLFSMFAVIVYSLFILDDKKFLSTSLPGNKLTLSTKPKGHITIYTHVVQFQKLPYV